MTVLSKTAFINQVNSLLADNSTRQISPLDLRTSFLDLVDSLGNLVNDAELNSANFSTPDTRTTIGGEQALSEVSSVGRTSTDNSAFGYRSLYENYQSHCNSAFGSFSLSCNSLGDLNTAVGHYALGGNTAGSGNTAIGTYALNPNKRGDFNIAIGYGAGYGAAVNDDYKFYLAVHPQASGACNITSSGDTIPFLYGDLQTKQLGIAVDSFVSGEKLRVSGDITPAVEDTFSIGRSGVEWNGHFHDLHVCNLYHTCDPPYIEGFMTEDVQAPSGYCFPTSGILRVKTVSASGELDGGTCQDGYDQVIINRDPTLAISGCQYVIAHKINYEYRPVHLACSGYCGE